MPRSTVRRKVDALVARAGVPLVEGTARGVVLTEVGSALATQNHCAQGDDDCERALIATKCLFDPAQYWPEATLRCTPCDADQS